jgi:hypothetical protein
MTTLPPSDPSVQFTPLAREGAWREGRASLKPAGKAAQLSWRSVMALMLLALATAHIPQPAAAQTCTAPPTRAASGQALTWNGTAWQCINAGATPINGACNGGWGCAAGYAVNWRRSCNCAAGLPNDNGWHYFQCIGHYGGAVANCSVYADDCNCESGGGNIND